jgi:hypothetical protein
MTVEKWLLLPLFLHVALISWVGICSIRARISSVVSGETKLRNIALNSGAWPDNVRKLGNNFDNQFDVPWLWYIVCAFMMFTLKTDVFGAVLSWGFFVSRVVHTYIHTGSNAVRQRMYAYLVGFALVFAMWAWFGIRFYVIG